MGCGEGRAEGITHRLEDVATVGFNGVTQDGVMALDGSLHLLGVLLPAFG